MTLDPVICRQAVLARDARFDGRFFTAVATTGIYCRPVCPVRAPKAENCRYYPTAAAAQVAGFRPCLRCRPETAPGQGAWRGTSNTVARAMALIEAGALDHGDIDDLAARLGVGGRHLRRLFKRHIGASPTHVAQTRRVLIAKQLLHESELSMSEVALAAGFGSVRRFDETLSGLFGRAPREIRRLAGAERAEGPITLSLAYRPPFDWDALVEFFALRAIAGVEAVDDGVYRRTIALGGAAGTLSVAHEAGRGRLRVAINFPRLAELPRIIARVRRMFDLDADPDIVGAALSRDPILARLVAARPGLRVPGAWDGFETGVRAILGQQISVQAAVRLAGRIVEACGEPIAAGALTRVFPTPQALARAELSGMPGGRIKALQALAEAACDEPELFERSASLEDGVARLSRIAGVGPWTAHYIALRAMREPDAFPASDIGLLRAAADGAGRPSAAALLARAERWRPWRAYAATHLWTFTPGKEAQDELAA